MHEVIICKCDSVEHMAVFSYYPEDKEVYMSVHLRPEPNIFKRIWKAIKYIFGYKSMFGHFDEFILDEKDYYKFEKVLKHLKPDV